MLSNATVSRRWRDARPFVTRCSPGCAAAMSRARETLHRLRQGCAVTAIRYASAGGGVVGARGLDPAGTKCRVVVPDAVFYGLAA
jgi:hypothetical protein